MLATSIPQRLASALARTRSLNSNALILWRKRSLSTTAPSHRVAMSEGVAKWDRAHTPGLLSPQQMRQFYEDG